MGNRFHRKEGVRKENKIVFIFSEGEKTEPIYFNSKKKEIETEIKRKGIKIEIKGSGFHTTSLVDYAIDYINIPGNGVDLTLDDCWVVFDRDDFDNDFDTAINKAQSHGLKVAYSNVAFELWFLLHFSFMSSAIGRKDYIKKLTENLISVSNNKSYKYDKATDIYPLIRSKEADAIRNAKALLGQFIGVTSSLGKNPSTTVHLLVESLNNLKS